MKVKDWLKLVYKEEWPTIGNHLASSGVAFFAATGFSYAERGLDSDAAISGIATFLDMGGYWGTFLPQLLYRDRKNLVEKDGSYNRRKVSRKCIEYAGYMIPIEGAYLLGRFYAQYELQKHGWPPAAAAATVQAGATAFFVFALPPIRYVARQWSEK